MRYIAQEGDIVSDREQILAFWDKNHSKPLGPKFSWMYERNPSGKARVWLLKQETSDQCVGMAVLFPRRFHVLGTTRVAGIAGDLLIHPKHRTMGPAIVLQRSVVAALNQGPLVFLYGFPNRNAEAVLKRVGYRSLGPRTRLVRIMKTAPQLRKRRLPEFWVQLLSPILDGALKLFSPENWRAPGTGWVCREVADFDERFDRLWDEIKTRFVVAGERTSEVLRWKFLQDPDDVHHIFAVFNRSNFRLCGYIVYREQDRSVDIRDIAFVEEHSVFSILMGGFLKHIRSSAAESVVIHFLKDDALIQKMRRFGFLEGESAYSIYLYCTEQTWEELNAEKHSGSWFLMQSDEDT